MSRGRPKEIRLPEQAIEWVIENVLHDFAQSSLYDDYQANSGWDDDDWRRMLKGLEQAKQAIAVVREFRGDCQFAAGGSHAKVVDKYLRDEWFDLAATYQHATAAVEAIGKVNDV
jgi:hypothetical protein